MKYVKVEVNNIHIRVYTSKCIRFLLNYIEYLEPILVQM